MLFPKALITSPADVSTPQSRHVAFPSCTCTLSCLLVCKPWCAAAACHGTLTLRPAQPGDPSFGQTAEAHLQLHLRLLRACSGRVKSLKLEALRVDLVPTTVQVWNEPDQNCYVCLVLSTPDGVIFCADGMLQVFHSTTRHL